MPIHCSAVPARRPRPARILYIHGDAGIGGAPLSLLFLIQKLDRRRYQPMVLCLRDGSAAQLYRDEGVPTYIGRAIRTFSHTQLSWYGVLRCLTLASRGALFLPSALATRQIVRELDPDIVHLNSSTLAPCALGARLVGRPVVWHIREPLHPGYLGVRRRLLKHAVHRWSDRVVAICDNDARQLFPSPRIRVIYNFVDLRTFDRRLPAEPFRREFGLRRRDRVVAMLGGVARTKGTLELVQAAALLRKQVPHLQVFVVGSTGTDKASGALGVTGRFLRTVCSRPSYSELVTQTVKRFGLDGTVRFTGVRRDIPRILAGVDLVTFPATVPHFARPVIEAGAMARPVVASDLGGANELVVDGVTGRLVPAGDPAGLAEAIAEILGDSEKARRMGEAGYDQARKAFNADTNAQLTQDVYAELLEGL